MGNAASRDDLGSLIDCITALLDGRKNLKLSLKMPLNLDDEQEQTKVTFKIMQVSHSYKESGEYWLATAHLSENMKYYYSAGDLGKCGHVLLEIADCLFSSGESEISIRCCEEAIPLMIGSRDQYSWARRMAAVGELLLAAIVLNLSGVHEALIALRKVRSRLTLKETRILFNEDAHRVSRKLVTAYKTGTREPLQELERIPPKRKRTEERNLLVFLDEWTSQYNAIKSSLEKLPSNKRRPWKSDPQE
nr:hypothetical protein [Candidatus Njordarchaeum guaymaensis]